MLIRENPSTNNYSQKEISISFSEDFRSEDLVEMTRTLDKDFNASVFQMIFTIKGDLKCLTKKDKKSFSIIESEKHNLVLFNPANLQLEHTSSDQNELVVINLSAIFLLKYLPFDHPGCQQLIGGIGKGKPASFSKHNMHITPEISSILNSMKHSQHEGFHKKLFLESKVLELLVIQFAQYDDYQTQSLKQKLKKIDLHKMHEVKNIIISNLEKQLPLRSLAHMVGTNEFNLKKQFKTAFGTTVYGYLNQYKMEQAKSMLIKGETKISEVSVKMGYKYPTHFTSAFKKYFGYLPTKIKLLLLLLDPELSFVFSIL
jgi:AraC-like DNA-binding protein